MTDMTMKGHSHLHLRNDMRFQILRCQSASNFYNQICFTDSPLILLVSTTRKSSRITNRQLCSYLFFIILSSSSFSYLEMSTLQHHHPFSLPSKPLHVNSSLQAPHCFVRGSDDPAHPPESTSHPYPFFHTNIWYCIGVS